MRRPHLAVGVSPWKQLSEKSPARHPPPHRRDGIAWERGRPARILSLITWERGRPARILSLITWERGRPARILSLITWERGRPARILFLITWERGRPARILFLWPPLSFSTMLQAATPVGGNSIGQAEGEPWRRSRLIQVGEMAEAVPGLVRAGRPRSQEALIP